MPLKMIAVLGYECTRCGHIWVPKNTEVKPKTCPNCRSPYFDTERKNTVNKVM
jgi:predicted  nucleic acid-binding Zn-ribbon protein